MLRRAAASASPVHVSLAAPPLCPQRGGLLDLVDEGRLLAPFVEPATQHAPMVNQRFVRQLVLHRIVATVRRTTDAHRTDS